MTDNSALLTKNDVAEQLKVTTKTIERWERRGLLTAVRIGGVVRYRQADVEALIRDGAA